MCFFFSSRIFTRGRVFWCFTDFTDSARSSLALRLVSRFHFKALEHLSTLKNERTIRLSSFAFWHLSFLSVIAYQPRSRQSIITRSVFGRFAFMCVHFRSLEKTISPRESAYAPLPVYQ